MLLLFCAIMNTWLGCSCSGSCCCPSCGMYLPTSNTLVYSPSVTSKASRAASIWCWWYRISSSGSASEKKSKKTLNFCIGQISVQGPPDHSQDKILSVTSKYQLRNTTGRWTICGQVCGAPVKSHLSSHKCKTWYFCSQLRNTVNMEL